MHWSHALTLCWGLHAGFVLGRQGELAFTAQSGRAALVLAGCGLLAFGLVSLARSAAAPLHEREQDPDAPIVPAQRTPEKAPAVLR